MAQSKYDYLKQFEIEDKILPNCWVAVRVDGKNFLKFSSKYKFEKPNDKRALKLMTRAAITVMEEVKDVIMAYGQSNEYSFILRKDTQLYNRRASKILTFISSLFSSSYVYFWSDYLKQTNFKTPPAFDCHIALYPTDENLRDYVSWRQADCHINNLYNTTYWALVRKGHLSHVEAEKRLCGTFSADKLEILFSCFNIKYSDEPAMYREGTTLLRKKIISPKNGKLRQVIFPLHIDMIQDHFWIDNSELLELSSAGFYDWPEAVPLPKIVQEQLRLNEPTYVPYRWPAKPKKSSLGEETRDDVDQERGDKDIVGEDKIYESNLKIDTNSDEMDEVNTDEERIPFREELVIVELKQKTKHTVEDDTDIAYDIELDDTI